MRRRTIKKNREAIARGEPVKEWVDDRPTKKPVDRDRNAAMQAARREPPRGLAGPSAPAGGELGEDAFAALLGGVTAEDLDELGAEEFSALRALALQHARQVMELPLRSDDKNFAKILAAKDSMAKAILTATVRTRPRDLMDQDDDGVAALLDEVRRESGDTDKGAAKTAADYSAEPPGGGRLSVEDRARADLFS